MKMYILLKDTLSPSHSALAAAHASLACYLKFKDDEAVKEWLNGPFYKTVCMVNETEFENAKQHPDHVVMTESTLEDTEVAIAFKPRHEYPKMFRFLRLYK